MNPALRVIIGRLAGVLAGILASYLASKGLTISSQDISTVIIELITVFVTAYGLVHTAANARVNPTGAPSPAIAQIVHEELKDKAIMDARMNANTPPSDQGAKNGGS